MIAAGRGRPLRFLGLAMSGWVSVRVVMLWPQLDSAASVLHAIAPIAAAAAEPAVAAPPPRVPRRVAPLPSVAHSAPPSMAMGRATMVRASRDPTRVALALLGMVRYGAPQPADDPGPIVPGLPRPMRATAPRSRWSGSAWLVARGGAGLAPGALGGQLGGSQAGVRLAYALDRKRRIALAGRVTSPLGRGLREAALGVEWQPTRLPVRLVAEQRVALAGGRGGAAAGVVGGVGPVGIPLGFRLDAYGQAGVIHRATTEAYADGAVRALHPLGKLGQVQVDLGAGAWGGAQRGATRLDLGPSLGVTVPLGKQPVRLSLDWRERVAGKAHPGSGPALTLGTDF